MYTIVFTNVAEKAIKKLPTADGRRALAAIDALRDDPRPVGCVKLTGSDLWRIRVGNYRVIYEIDDDVLVVTVVEVGHRKDVYR